MAPNALDLSRYFSLGLAPDKPGWSEAGDNFDYDYGAHQTVERNFQRMVKAGQLEEALELALELMRSGSYQVEMSDEGMRDEG